MGFLVEVVWEHCHARRRGFRLAALSIPETECADRPCGAPILRRKMLCNNAMKFTPLAVSCNRKFFEYTFCNSYPVFGRSAIWLVVDLAGCDRGCQWSFFEVAMVGTQVLDEMAERPSDQIGAVVGLPA